MVFPEQSHVKWQILRAVFLGFVFFLILAFAFRFSAKIQAVFRIWYLTQFSVLPVWFLVSDFLNRERVSQEPNADVMVEKNA